MLGFHEDAVPLIFSNMKMSNIVVNNRKLLFGNSSPFKIPLVRKVTVRGRFVFEVPKLMETIRRMITTTDFIRSCSLCFEEYPLEKLLDACGNCNCDSRCCADCLKSWYGQNKPGNLFLPSHAICPFCRTRPTYKVLLRYNRPACAIVGTSRKMKTASTNTKTSAFLQLRSDWYYGWCDHCWKVAYALDRRCAGANDGAVVGGLPELKNFKCEECLEQIRAQDAFLEQAGKDCPGCGIKTSHMGGCSHMTCSVCQTHWCWQCQFQGQNASEVYEHMNQVHNGYAWVAG